MKELATEEPQPHTTERRHHRTIRISDVHLGTSSSMAEQLCDFLKYNSCDTLDLVGDIIDGWGIKKRLYWPQQHINVVRRILTRAKRWTKIAYITGNHDEFLRRYPGMTFGNIHLVDKYIHHAADGKQYWVVHGDAFDAMVFKKKWLAAIGDIAYESLFKVNVWLNRARSAFGMRHWSLSSYLKNKARNAFSIIAKYETTLARECIRRELNGVICGHIHHPVIKEIDGVHNGNCGDRLNPAVHWLKILPWHRLAPSSTDSAYMESEIAT